MTRTEFLSKLLKYQSLQHASIKKTNSDGTWKNHKYLYIDKNGNYVYEDKTSKASADNAKGAGDDYQRYLDEQKLKKASANQSGSAKQGEAAGKAQQKYQEQQKLKKQQGNQSGSAKQGEAEGKAQQEYLNNKKEEKMSQDLANKVVSDNLAKILAGAMVEENIGKNIDQVKTEDEKVKNKINDFIKNPANYNYSINVEAYEKGLKDIIENTEDYKSLVKEVTKELDKTVNNEFTDWPDWNTFWTKVGDKAQAIADRYIPVIDEEEGSWIKDEFNREVKYVIDNDIRKIWNEKIKEAEVKAEEREKEKEHKKEIAEIYIKNSDEAKEMIKAYKNFITFHDSGKVDESLGIRDNDNWGDSWDSLREKAEELARQLKDNDKSGTLKDYTVKDLSDKLYYDTVHYHNASDDSGIYNTNEYGLDNRKIEQIKSQIISQNTNKTEESVQKAISGDLKFLEKDLNKIVDNDDEWASTWGSNFDLTMSSQGLNNACADMDMRLKNIRQEEIHDPDTGLPIKAYETTFEEDMALINYHRQNEKDMLDSWEYGYNCSACTIAMCLRMQGYDVSANARGEMEWNSKRWDMFKEVTHSGEFNDKNEFYNYVISQPAGSYGDISVDWASGSGHSMFYKISDDGKKFEVYCTQTNSKVDVNWLLEHSSNWRLTRLDNAELDGMKCRESNWIKYY